MTWHTIDSLEERLTQKHRELSKIFPEYPPEAIQEIVTRYSDIAFGDYNVEAKKKLGEFGVHLANLSGDFKEEIILEEEYLQKQRKLWEKQFSPFGDTE
jgi:hypothetical protein